MAVRVGRGWWGTASRCLGKTNSGATSWLGTRVAPQVCTAGQHFENFRILDLVLEFWSGTMMVERTLPVEQNAAGCWDCEL